MINKKRAIKNKQNINNSSTQLWQTVSEEEQNAVKGGWPPLRFWPPGIAIATANASENSTLNR